MSKHWREKSEPKKHMNFMSTSHVEGISLADSKANNDGWIYFVRECSFTFQFVNLNQLDQMIDFFSSKIHPSTKTEGITIEHYWQKWHERIPKGLIKDSKRLRIVKALKKAKLDFQNSAL